MSSKEYIINSIKKTQTKKSTPLPNLEDIKHIEFENRLDVFINNLQNVGGYAKELEGLKLEKFLEKNYPNSIIVTTIKNLYPNSLHINDFQDSHDLKNVDLAIVKGEFGVAENGAVWIKEKDINHRAIYFIAKSLLIILDKNEIVSSMHEAYKKIEFENNSFGIFISGPSKTADIEQALVIGAHGAMKCCVLLV